MTQDGEAVTGNRDYRAILDHLDAIVYTKDLNGRYTYVSQRTCQALRRPPHDIIGKTDHDLFPAPSADELHQNDLEVFRTGRTVASEQKLSMPPAGEIRHFWSVKQPLLDAQDNLIGLSGISTDITELKRKEDDLRELKNHYSAALKAMPDLLFELDLEGRYHDFHSPRQDLLAAPPHELFGKTVHDVLPADVADLCMTALHEALEKGHSSGRQFQLAVPGGHNWFELSVAPKTTAPGDIPHFIVLSRDITDRKLAEQALQKSESMLRAIVDNTPVQYWARDMEGRCIMQNALVVKHWGNLLGTRPQDSDIRPEDLELWQQNNARAYAGEVVSKEVEYLVDGEKRTFQNLVAPIKVEGQTVGIVGFNQDITERKQAEDKIRTLAFFDSLSQLPNRRLMFDRLEHALTASARHRRQGALLLIDLDNFKQLNDTMGHEAGDLLLMEVANRLKSGIRQTDTAARLGGDEFVVILEDLEEGTAGITQAEQVAQHIQQRLNRPYLLEITAENRQYNYQCSCSIGIALFHDCSASGEELLRRADTAMYQAKSAGRNCLRFFDPAMQALVAARATLESDMRAALDLQQFILHYQPQIGADGRITGAEALLRWQHPLRGMVSPADFIPLAEETGLIIPLGLWVLETACVQLAQWARQPATAALTLAVNVSARQFHLPGFVQTLEGLLERTGAPGNRLKLELTESLLLDHSDAIIQRMQHLQALGIGFSLDDFGTGYSSLVYLKRLPLDQLKIDRSFVRDILSDPNDAVIARTIVALGDSLGLDVIAEGVETEAQRELLVQIGCHRYQGFLFGRPVPLAQFESQLAR